MGSVKSNRARRPVLLAAAAAAAAVLAALWLIVVPGGAAQGAARPGPRVTIAVFGDSVAEGYEIPHYLRDSLVPLLRAGVARAGGFEPGAAGLVPFTPFRWRFNSYSLNGIDPPRAGGWLLFGDSAAEPSGFHPSDAVDGPSGYSGIPLAAAATATVPVDARSVAVLFTKFVGGGTFTVTAGSQSFAIDSYSSGPPTPSQQWITLPPGVRTITVHGPLAGSAIVDGAIVRAPVAPGRIGIELEDLGHRGHHLAEDSAPRILASLRQQRFDVSVFLDGYIWAFGALIGGGARQAAGYASELRVRAGLVRSYGGLCLIADPSPLGLPKSILDRFAAIDRRVARAEGCAYTAALAHLWDPRTAVARGFTLVDAIHPSAAGYRLMAAALVPELVRLVRQRVRTRVY
jgi:lysophospholipase L1-like esterase